LSAVCTSVTYYLSLCLILGVVLWWTLHGGSPRKPPCLQGRQFWMVCNMPYSPGWSLHNCPCCIQHWDHRE